MLFHQAGGLELVQHAVYGGKTDVFVGQHKVAVNIVGGNMLGLLIFQDLQDPLTRMGNFQPGFSEVSKFHGGLSLIFESLSQAKCVHCIFLVIPVTIASRVIVSFTLFALPEKPGPGQE